MQNLQASSAQTWQERSRGSSRILGVNADPISRCFDHYTLGVSCKRHPAFARLIYPRLKVIPNFLFQVNVKQTHARYPHVEASSDGGVNE